MGWSSGYDVMNKIAKVLMKHTMVEQRRKIYPRIIEILEDHDWDTQPDSMGVDPILDEFLETEE